MSNYQDSLWTFRIKDSLGNVIATIPKCRRRSVKMGLNRAGEATFTYSLKDFYDYATNIFRYGNAIMRTV